MKYKTTASYPRISIVVPAFNEDRNILYLFKSLEKQNVKNFQVICVDNNSTDNKAAKVLGYQKNSPFPLYLVHETKPGPGNARKKGAEFVIKQIGSRSSRQNHIIATTDADCVVQPDWTKVIENTFLSGDCGVAGGAHTGRSVIDNKIRTNTGIKNYFRTIALINEYLAINQIGLIKLSGPNSAIRLDAYMKAAGFIQPLNPDGTIGVKELTRLGNNVVKAGYKKSYISCFVISSRRRHFVELMTGHEMYIHDKNDQGKRFISIRNSEGKLLNKALKTVSKYRWQKYQDLLIGKVVYNMIIKPAIDKQLDLAGLKKIGYSGQKIREFKKALESIENVEPNFDHLYSNCPGLFLDLTVAIKKTVLINS